MLERSPGRWCELVVQVGRACGEADAAIVQIGEQLPSHQRE
jgi:hypothetical protein